MSHRKCKVEAYFLVGETFACKRMKEMERDDEGVHFTGQPAVTRFDDFLQHLLTNSTSFTNSIYPESVYFSLLQPLLS